MDGGAQVSSGRRQLVSGAWSEVSHGDPAPSWPPLGLRSTLALSASSDLSHARQWSSFNYRGDGVLAQVMAPGQERSSSANKITTERRYDKKAHERLTHHSDRGSRSCWILHPRNQDLVREVQEETVWDKLNRLYAPGLKAWPLQLTTEIEFVTEKMHFPLNPLTGRHRHKLSL
ncbi:unnamed protein product [Pleuronectes platessa]|uniref:Uncharacterized protein n=1 Tax=Pleuronectes platessa TaxID=8262 RepID=A0A9N7YB13_PLEPL|nr:unnamed protein product [Pleuronectes platessa]